jgi:hypothetical protein
MTTKGSSLTPATRQKISLLKTRINKNDIIKAGIEYLEEWQAQNPEVRSIPTVAGFCLKAKVSRSYMYELAQTIPEVADIIEVINANQENIALTEGIKSKLNPVFAIFLLKSRHNYLDQPKQLNQTNNYQIHPDLLAAALKIMREEK